MPNKKKQSDLYLETKTHVNRPRRIVLGTLGAIVFVPKEWTKPVVKAIVLPVHAQMSPGEDGDDKSEEQETLSFEACSISLDYRDAPFSPPATFVDTTISGVVSGPGNVEGIELSFEAILTNGGTETGGSPKDLGTMLTNADGSYELMSLQVAGIGLLSCTTDGSDVFDSPAFPAVDTITIVVSSDDPLLTGTVQCFAEVDCAEVLAPFLGP